MGSNWYRGLILIGLFFCLTGCGYKVPKKLEKEKFDQARFYLESSLARDSINAASNYFYSLLYLDTAYLRFNIDSSYYYIRQAIEDLPREDEKEYRKLLKAGINDRTLEEQLQNVHEAAFQVSLYLNTVEGYNIFLQGHPDAPQVEDATEKRNALAFERARAINTYQAYQQFLEEYPTAIQVREAEELYNILIFKAKTQEGRLKNYVEFLENNPDSPYRLQAEQNIYEMLTADNKPESYLKFIEQYTSSPFVNKATDFLYHIFKEQNPPQAFWEQKGVIISDSLGQAIDLEDDVLFPIYENGNYGFLNDKGKVVFPLTLKEIQEDLICGGIAEDWLVLETEKARQIVGKNSALIFPGKFDQVEDIGYGLLKVSQQGKKGVIHKGGYPVLEFGFDDLDVLGGEFIRVFLDNDVGLYTFSSRKLLDPDYVDIQALGPFIILRNREGFAVTNRQQILKVLDEEKPVLDFRYDDFELLDDEHLLLFEDDREVLLDPELNPVIPAGQHQIFQISTGWLVREPNGYSILDPVFKPISDTLYQRVEFNSRWVALRKNKSWSFYADNYIGHGYDSIRIPSENYAFLLKGDSLTVYFSNELRKSFTKNFQPRILKPASVSGKNLETEYLLLASNRKDLVFNTEGLEILSGSYNDIQALGLEYLLLEKGGKKGLSDRNGKQLLSTRYDGIANYNQGYLSLLSRQKFGIIHSGKDILIEPRYDAMLRIYNDSLLIATFDGKKGIVDGKNNKLLNFEFDQIEYWNDTSVLALKEDQWGFYSMGSGERKGPLFDDFSIIRNDPAGSKIVEIRIGAKFGVYSNSKGEIISPTYNDIVNVGTPEKPILFCEVNLREADFLVILYFNGNGEIIRKQAMDGEEYMKIYCE